MNKQYLSQELGIAYYRTMSKFVQYRRNLLKNNMYSVKAKTSPIQIFTEKTIQ